MVLTLAMFDKISLVYKVLVAFKTPRKPPRNKVGQTSFSSIVMNLIAKRRSGAKLVLWDRSDF
eukprot:15198287-Alexandrium_andersonii.AAC.1